MASILEGTSNLIGFFLPFILAIFIFSIVFAFLEKTKIFGENSHKGRSALISVAIALLVISVPDVVRLMSVIVPWFFFFFLFLMLIQLGYMFIGGSDKGIWFAFGGREDMAGGENSPVWFFLVIGFVIIAIAAGSVFGDTLLPLTQNQGNTADINDSGILVTQGNTDTGSFKNNFAATLFHPAVLGLAAFFLIATFAILFLGQ